MSKNNGSENKSRFQNQNPFENQLISEVVSEFVDVFAFARNRWAKYVEEVHSDLRGLGIMVLQVIMRKGSVTATEISKFLSLDKAVVSRQVTKLRDLGLVEATPSEDDGRVIQLVATAESKKFFEKLKHQNAQEYSKRFENWTDSELQQLRDFLHRFNNSDTGFKENKQFKEI